MGLRTMRLRLLKRHRAISRFATRYVVNIFLSANHFTCIK